MSENVVGAIKSYPGVLASLLDPQRPIRALRHVKKPELANSGGLVLITPPSFFTNPHFSIFRGLYIYKRIISIILKILWDLKMGLDYARKKFQTHTTISHEMKMYLIHAIFT